MTTEDVRRAYQERKKRHKPSGTRPVVIHRTSNIRTWEPNK